MDIIYLCINFWCAFVDPKFNLHLKFIWKLDACICGRMLFLYLSFCFVFVVVCIQAFHSRILNLLLIIAINFIFRTLFLTITEFIIFPFSIKTCILIIIRKLLALALMAPTHRNNGQMAVIGHTQQYKLDWLCSLCVCAHETRVSMDEEDVASIGIVINSTTAHTHTHTGYFPIPVPSNGVIPHRVSQFYTKKF